MRTAIVVCVVTGCSFDPRAAAIDAPREPDARPPPDAIDARVIDAGVNCFGADPYLVCLGTIPGLALTLGAQTFDTDGCSGGEVITHGTQELCVLAGTDVTISGNRYRAEGGRPLVVVATHDLVVEAGAYLDVSSFVGSPLGAGANFAGCVAAAPGSSDNNGGGGGGGGSFGTTGGNGGNGSATGGAAAPQPPPSILRGGCSGAQGGNGQSTAGGGGNSGGAIYLVAANTLSIAGIIDASAAGGQGAPSGKNGGGGGGSGGMIALFGGASISVAGAQLFANGGGGGAGSDSSTAGGNGQQSTAFDDVAEGGAANGGAGATAAQPSTNGGNSGKGAGGGGGGLGVIENVSGQSLSAGSFSPSPS